MRQIREGSVLFYCQIWISCWKNQDIGSRDGICGGKMRKSKQLPKCHTVTKGTSLNGILLSNIHFSLELHSKSTFSFQLELHSKSLFHKLMAISRYETNFDTPAKSHFLRILDQKWHVTQWRWHIWQTVQNPKIVNKTAQWRDLSNKGACKSFHMQFAKVGEQKGL